MPREHGGESSEKLLAPVTRFAAPLLLCYFAGIQAFVYDSYLSGGLLTAMGIAAAFGDRVHRAGYSLLQYLSVLIVVGVVGTAFFRGGVIWGVLAWLAFPPLAFILTFRFKAAIGWSLVVLSAIASLFGLQHFECTPERVETLPGAMLGGMVVATLGLIGIVLAQAWSRQQAQRERQLIEQRLLRANKLESVARLAGGVAHDFNNLLTVITNHAQLLAERGPDSDVAAIQQAASVGTALTRRLLAIGRERDDSDELQSIDLNGVGAKVASLLRTLMPPGVQLSFDAAPGPAFARACPWDVHQVLMNLVINARDAMPSGGAIGLSVSFATPEADLPVRFGVLKPGSYVVLRVKDTGVGMSEAMMNKVVEPFFTTRGRKGGTGLGLSIVYGMTRAQGGLLDIESVVDEGTTFSIYLPYCDKARMETRPHESTSSFPAAPAQVLLVDDDPAVRRSIARLLGLEGHEVITAEGTNDARQKFRDGHANVLVTDVSMPDGSGVDLARELLLSFPELGVVFVSGSGDHTTIESPNVRYLTKPASRVELRNAVRAVGGRSRTSHLKLVSRDT